MPKIDAPTVAEHRALKERAILEATVTLLVTQGQDAVTPAAVAQRSGLARTSVYQYHSSSASLVAAAVEELFRIARIEVRQRMEPAGSDVALRLDAYVDAMLAVAQSGHSPSRPIDLGGAPIECRMRIRELHDDLVAPLREIALDLGCDNVDMTVAIAFGAIQGAVQMLEHGTPPDTVSNQTTAFLRRALLDEKAKPKGL